MVTDLVLAILAHCQTAALTHRRFAPRAQAFWRPFGAGHGDAEVDLVELLVDLAFPLVVPPVRIPAPLSAKMRSLVSSAWEQ